MFLFHGAKAKQEALDDQVEKNEEFWNKAKAAKEKALTAVQTAETAVNESPEAQQLAIKQKSDEDKLEQAKKLVSELEKNATEKGLNDFAVQHVKVDGKKYGVSLNTAREDAKKLEQNVEDDKNAAQPAQTALATAKKDAENATRDFNQLDKENRRLVQANNDNRKNAPALLAAQQQAQDIKLQNELLSEPTRGGFALNQQQRMGSYATPPPDFKRMTEAAIRTANNTDGLRGNPQAPPGSRPPQYGGTPHR